MKTKAFIISLIIFCLLFANFVSVDAGSELEEDPLVQGWSKDIRLTNNTPYAIHPDIAVDLSEAVHVVWQDRIEGFWGIYYMKSTDGGATWSGYKRLNNLSNSGGGPSIAITSDNTLHVGWSGATQEEPYGEVYYVRSTDGGENWGEEIRLTYASEDSHAPQVVPCGETLYLIWADKRDSNGEIYFKKSSDAGNTWDSDVRITYNDGYSRDPTLTVDLAENIHVVWYDDRDGVYKPYYAMSKDEGKTWSYPVPLSGGHNVTNLLAPRPNIISDSFNNLHVIWQDGLFRSEKIFYRKKIAEDNLWEAEKEIIEETPWAELPSATIDSQDNLHIIWKDGRNWSEEGTDVIYYKRISPNGSVWHNDTRITFENKGCLGLKLTIDKYNILHMAWVDQRTDNKEVYYKCTLTPVIEPPIIITQTLNQTSCIVGDSITVSGTAIWNNTPVANANVTITILETAQQWSTTTDSNGDYNLTIIAPTTPGDYTIRVTITYGNLTGHSLKKLTVIQESITGNGQRDNLMYLVAICAIAVLGAILAIRIGKWRRTRVTKVEKERERKIR